MSGSSPRVALSIAGSDSGGGAGIQADLATFSALGVFGTTAVTAVTAQSTTGVRRVDVLRPESVVSQVEAVLEDLEVAAVKTGMLAEAGLVVAVAELAASGRLPHLVLDPVMVASSGAVLASPEAVAAYRSRLLPLAEIATPNLAEAAVLAGVQGAGARDQEALACRLGEAYATTVVVKGGHTTGESVADVLWRDGEITRFERPRLTSTNTHGSGCSFAAAITAGLALGAGLPEAVEAAGWYVQRAIAGASGWELGHGPGPLDHFGWGSRQ